MKLSKIKAVLDDLDVRTIKIGMLYDEQTTRTVARTLKSHFSVAVNAESISVVCDPVCVSTSGYSLLTQPALDLLISEIFPICTLITPNKSEAELLLRRYGKSQTIQTLEDMLRAAETLGDIPIRGDSDTQICTSVLLKGGHISASFADLRRLETNQPDVKVVKQHLLIENMEILLVESPDYRLMQVVVDVLWQKNVRRKTAFVRPRIDTKSTHGTGCTLSSAIAAELAKGSSRKRIFCSSCLSFNNICKSRNGSGKGYNVYSHRYPSCKSHWEWTWSSEPFARYFFQDHPKVGPTSIIFWWLFISIFWLGRVVRTHILSLTC